VPPAQRTSGVRAAVAASKTSSSTSGRSSTRRSRRAWTRGGGDVGGGEAAGACRPRPRRDARAASRCPRVIGSTSHQPAASAAISSAATCRSCRAASASVGTWSSCHRCLVSNREPVHGDRGRGEESAGAVTDMATSAHQDRTPWRVSDGEPPGRTSSTVLATTGRRGSSDEVQRRRSHVGTRPAGAPLKCGPAWVHESSAAAPRRRLRRRRAGSAACAP
jgi:hypothetical protein